MFHRFSTNALNLLFEAQDIAMQFNQPYLSSEHLLLAMIDKKRNLKNVFLQQDVDLKQLKTLVRRLVGIGAPGEKSPALPMTPGLQVVIENALELADDGESIQDLHLLLALLKDEENAACGALEELDFDLSLGAKDVEIQLSNELKD